MTDLSMRTINGLFFSQIRELTIRSRKRGEAYGEEESWRYLYRRGIGIAD